MNIFALAPVMCFSLLLLFILLQLMRQRNAVPLLALPVPPPVAMVPATPGAPPPSAPQPSRQLLEPLYSRGTRMCDFLLEAGDKKSPEAILCLHNLIAINAIQNLPRPTSQQYEQLFFALHHFPRNFTSLVRQANGPEDKINQWLGNWHDLLRDPQRRYTLKLPTAGASIQTHWMSAPAGTTTIRAIDSWAVYFGDQLKFPAFVS